VRPVKDSVSGVLQPPQLDDSWAGHRYVQVNRNTDDVRDGNHNNPDRSFRQSITHKAWQEPLRWNTYSPRAQRVERGSDGLFLMSNEPRLLPRN
jgi:hypothetical protein